MVFSGTIAVVYSGTIAVEYSDTIAVVYRGTTAAVYRGTLAVVRQRWSGKKAAALTSGSMLQEAALSKCVTEAAVRVVPVASADGALPESCTLHEWRPTGDLEGCAIGVAAVAPGTVLVSFAVAHTLVLLTCPLGSCCTGNAHEALQLVEVRRVHMPAQLSCLAVSDMPAAAAQGGRTPAAPASFGPERAADAEVQIAEEEDIRPQ
eukprot:gene28895-35896_t